MGRRLTVQAVVDEDIDLPRQAHGLGKPGLNRLFTHLLESHANVARPVGRGRWRGTVTGPAGRVRHLGLGGGRATRGGLRGDGACSVKGKESCGSAPTGRRPGLGGTMAATGGTGQWPK